MAPQMNSQKDLLRVMTMGEMYTEDGEILEFVGLKETRLRGTVQTDGMGRHWISTDEDGDAGDLPALLPDEVDTEWINDHEDSADEYVFYVTVDARKPTGEYRGGNDG